MNLLCLSHPNIANSFINKHLTQMGEKNGLFLLHHLDKFAKDGCFDLKNEIDLLKNADNIIWQFPLYWYNCPASLRMWQDNVFSPIVYGENFLKGKKLAVIFTAGAAAETYCKSGLNRYNAQEMLCPFEMCANAAHMIWQKPLGIYSCSNTMSENQIKEAEQKYVAYIKSL